MGIVTVDCDASHALWSLFFKAIKKGCRGPLCVRENRAPYGSGTALNDVAVSTRYLVIVSSLFAAPFAILTLITWMAFLSE